MEIFDYIISSFYGMDWESFFINIYAGAIYFILGIIASVFIIPYYTYRLIKKKNRKYLDYKISHSIYILSAFLNRMPYQFLTDGKPVSVLRKHKLTKGYHEFVSYMKRNYLNELTSLEIARNVLYVVKEEQDSNKSFELLKGEKDRLGQLKKDLEGILSSHTLNLEDGQINEISLLCFKIRKFEDQFQDNIYYKELTGEHNGRFGATELSNAYTQVLFLLQLLSSSKIFIINKELEFSSSVNLDDKKKLLKIE